MSGSADMLVGRGRVSRQLFAQRYWNSLIGAEQTQRSGTGARGREGYSFWQRYWASLTGTTLPVRHHAGSDDRSVVPTSDPPVRRRRDSLFTAEERPGGYFSLPLPPLPAVLAAADGDDAVVLRVLSPDGRVEFLLHRREAAEHPYSVEIVLRAVDALPAVVSLRYTTRVEGQERTLLIPVTRALLGPPSAGALLMGFDPAATWSASASLGPEQVDEWTEDTIEWSVQAAQTEATRQAWRDVRPFVPRSLWHILDQGLR